MTLCIAALCKDDEEHGGRPCVVLSFDRRIETLTAGADIEFKYELLSNKWGALLAGDIALARELTASYAVLFHQTENFSGFSQTELIASLRSPINALREELADRLVRKNLATSLTELKQHGQAQLPDDVYRQVWYDISAQEMNVQLILFGWCDDGFRLFKISFGQLNGCEPFAVIGSGADIAEPALFQREYRHSWKLPQALYVVYEAQRLGSIAPGVSKNPESINEAVMYYDSELGRIVARPTRPVTSRWLQECFDEYGPRLVPNDLALPEKPFFDFGERLRQRKQSEADGVPSPPS